VTGPQLLAVAVHDEQAVVDGQAEAHGGGEVEGVDRHLGHARQQLEHQERAEDRHDADHQRQAGGHHAAEDQHQQDQRDGQGDHLGLDEILLDGVADLVEHLGEAADLDLQRLAVTAALEAGPQLLDAGFDLVVITLDAGDDQGAAAVVAAQRRGVVL
jgi:hypothetical protein